MTNNEIADDIIKYNYSFKDDLSKAIALALQKAEARGRLAEKERLLNILFGALDEGILIKCVKELRSRQRSSNE